MKKKLVAGLLIGGVAVIAGVVAGVMCIRDKKVEKALTADEDEDDWEEDDDDIFQDETSENEDNPLGEVLQRQLDSAKHSEEKEEAPDQMYEEKGEVPDQVRKLCL